MAKKPPVRPLRSDHHVESDVSDDQTCRIGQVIKVWSSLEAAMEDTIWTFLSLDFEDGRIVTKRLGTEAKVQMIRALGQRHLQDEKLLGTFNKKMATVDELKDARNFIAHGVWTTLMPDNIPMAASLKPKSEIGEVVSEGFETERMEAICAEIVAMRDYFVDLRDGLGQRR